VRSTPKKREEKAEERRCRGGRNNDETVTKKKRKDKQILSFGRWVEKKCRFRQYEDETYDATGDQGKMASG